MHQRLLLMHPMKSFPPPLSYKNLSAAEFLVSVLPQLSPPPFFIGVRSGSKAVLGQDKGHPFAK